MKVSEAAAKVMGLARKVHDYYAAQLPKRYPNYPLVGLDEESVPPPPEEKELREFLAALSEETLYQLLLILYLGRGDLGTNDLAGYFENLKGTVGDPEQAASRLMIYKATLADELSDGLEELRKQNINMDKMPLKKVKVRKR
jgi:hypothetical protein